MRSGTDKNCTQSENTNSQFQPISSYIPIEDMEADDAIPKRLFDVRSMKLVETSNIIDKEKIKYIAISYSWNEIHQANLQAPNISWEVKFSTSDWFSTVCEKVKEIQINYIWIDSLCIKQDSQKDKELQVPLMGDYYHGAELVMAVLDDIGQYREDILSSLQILDQIPYDIEFDMKYSSVPNWYELEHYVAAENLIGIISKSRWSKRIWTVQEIRLSKNSIYFIPYVASFTDKKLSKIMMLKYMGASSQIEDITKHMKELPVKFKPTESLSVGSIMPDKKKRYVSITEAQHLLFGRSCTLEQDKIYGILGLLSYGRSLKVDYNLSLHEIEKKLYTLASINGDNTWISGNGERHPHPGWSMAMRSGDTPSPSIIYLLSAPRINNDSIEIVGIKCGRWRYVKELTPLIEPDTESREVPLTKTCTSIITATSMRSNSLESCTNALKSAFYLYDAESDSKLASIVDRNGIFDNWEFTKGIERWSAKKLKGKDQGALFASASVIIPAWYRFGKRLSLIEIDTNCKDKNYRAVASLDENQASGDILMIGFISKEFSVCIPVIKSKEKLVRVGGIILVPINELNQEISPERFSML